MLQLFETPTKKLSPKAPASGKAALGQYMTPSNIAAFMASLFPDIFEDFHLLDAGAGEGSLSCAFLEALHSKSSSQKGKVSLFEFDAGMVNALEKNIPDAIGALLVKYHIHHADFIEQATMLALRKERLFTHAILNPPYKKISSNSLHRGLLRDVGIETVNLYTAFVALAVALLKPEGQLVAIIPRSFCNGPYYKPFREFILRHTAIQHIHLFKSRTEAFKTDKVLQENVIIRLERDAKQGDITVSTSKNGDMDDYAVAQHPFASIVRPDDPQKFIHIPDGESSAKHFTKAASSLAALGLEVSTGPVVDFRLKDYLRAMPQDDDAPLLYSGHFNGKTEWPKEGFKKPNAIACCPETMKWLYPNGHYVVVRRLSSKEEKRRIVAYLVDPALFPAKPFLGFENHLNVFHCRKNGLDEDAARGLVMYLNSHYLDTLFRRFNGHTQVNATDLRALPYPSRQTLKQIGSWAKKQDNLSQETIEQHLENILA